MKRIILLLSLLFGATIALGFEAFAEAEADAPAAHLESTVEASAEPAVEAEPVEPEWLAKIIAFVIGLQVMLYGLSTGLMKIAKWTETDVDNKIAGYLGQAAWLLGSILGRFGYSVPKDLAIELAKSGEKSKDT